MSLNLSNIEMTPELSKYACWIKDLRRSNSSTLVFNDGKECAAILLKNIFESAKESVSIYCDSLRPELSETAEYFNALKDCKDRGVSIRVLLNSNDTSILERPIFKMLDKDSIGIISKESSGKMRKLLNDMAVHFTVVDGCVYRMEYDIENFKAIASFNDADMSSALKSAFDEIWDSL